MTWITTNLATLVDRIESGGRPKGGASEGSGEIPSLGGENIRQAGSLDLESVRKVPRAFYARMTKGILRHNDILINKDGANTGKVGFYEGQFNEACVNEHLFLIRGLQETVDQKFLYYLLLFPTGQNIIRSKISGSAQPGLKGTFAQNFPVCVPISVAEQRQIASVLTEIDLAITRTEALIAKYERIKTGLMHDLLTRGIDEHGRLRDPATHPFKASPLGMIPVEWEVRPLKEIAQVDRGQFKHRPRDAPEFYGGKYPFIQTGDITKHVGRRLSVFGQTLSELGTKVSRLFPANTIAVTIAANIGDTAILGIPMYFPDSIVGVVVDKEQSPRFVELCIRSRKMTFDSLAPQSAQKNINLQDLRPMLVPIPHSQEQIRISQLYETVDRVVELEESSLSKLQRLKAGLMQDLLTGKVSVELLLDAAATQEG